MSSAAHYSAPECGFHSPSQCIADRLKIRMAALGITASELARRSDLKPSFLYDIISGKSTNPSVVKLARIAAELDVGVSYFLGDSKHTNGHNGSASDGQHGESETDAQWVRLNWLSASYSPYLPSGFAQHAEVPLLFNKEWLRERCASEVQALCLLRVKGEAMMPALREGDVVIVDITDTRPSPPGIFVLFDGEGVSLKRVELMAGTRPSRVRLIADNPCYPMIEQPLEQLELVGRVVWGGVGL